MNQVKIRRDKDNYDWLRNNLGLGVIRHKRELRQTALNSGRFRTDFLPLAVQSLLSLVPCRHALIICIKVLKAIDREVW